MSADWKAGDRALCVDDSISKLTGKWPVKDRIYLVLEVDVCTNTGLLVLFLADEPVEVINGQRVGWFAHRFRKLVPACDRITQEQEASP